MKLKVDGIRVWFIEDGKEVALTYDGETIDGCRDTFNMFYRYTEPIKTKHLEGIVTLLPQVKQYYAEQAERQKELEAKYS